MRSLTFVVGTGRSGSTALSRIVNEHPDVLSLNELLATVGGAGLPPGRLGGTRFWQLLARPNPLFDTMIRSGLPLPEFLYPLRPGRFSARTTGIPALCLTVLPHLTDAPDALFDDLREEVTRWPVRTAARHYEALFGTLCARFGRSAVVERSGYSTHWIPRLRAAFPRAKFVHLFRDGPDCALSMSRHTGFRLILLLREITARTGVTNPADLTEDDIRSLPPELSGVLADPIDPALVNDRDLPIGAFGALWSELVVQGVELLGAVPPDRRTTLAYESLLDHPRTELARLAEFIGVAPDPRWLDTGSALLDAGRRGASRRLPPERLAVLRDQCAPGARALALQ
ncbi:sulfotransferase [Streptomyces sp. NPDC004609]|uniref:sulfotransferase n=1 Tax=Streptomyces sp. NPDC004609 TaxID=3364704 RepID=UPI0036AAD04F